MLSEISLSNFKCFKEEISFPLANINIFTGINGSGKSSVIQSLLLMRQSVDIDNYTDKVYLNGNCVDLGTVESIKNIETSRELPILIKFKKNIADFNGMYLEMSYEFSTQDLFKSDGIVISLNLNDRHLTIENIIFESNFQFSEDFLSTDTLTNKVIVNIANKSISANNRKRGFEIFPNLTPEIFLKKEDKTIFDSFNYLINFQKIHYIAADRIGPQNFYHYTNTSKFIAIDKQGQYAPFVLFKKKDDLIYDSLCLGQDAKTVEQQTEEWLNQILDGARVKIKAENETINIYYNSGFKPSNVGFGYSYILPIIISGLIAQKGEILIVENPEAHLHPNAQSKLAQFLAKVAACGIQVFIETHSEHIINGIRLASAKDIIDTKDIQINFFKKEDNEVKIIPISVSESSDLSKYPKGFFDQSQRDNMEMIRIKKDKNLL